MKIIRTLYPCLILEVIQIIRTTTINSTATVKAATTTAISQGTPTQQKRRLQILCCMPH